jgi:hypothetical protein
VPAALTDFNPPVEVSVEESVCVQIGCFESRCELRPRSDHFGLRRRARNSRASRHGTDQRSGSRRAAWSRTRTDTSWTDRASPNGFEPSTRPTARRTSAAAGSVTTMHNIEQLSSCDADDLGRPQPMFERSVAVERHLIEPDRCRCAHPVRVVDSSRRPSLCASHSRDRRRPSDTARLCCRWAHNLSLLRPEAPRCSTGGRSRDDRHPLPRPPPPRRHRGRHLPEPHSVRRWYRRRVILSEAIDASSDGQRRNRPFHCGLDTTSRIVTPPQQQGANF